MPARRTLRLSPAQRLGLCTWSGCFCATAATQRFRLCRGHASTESRAALVAVRTAPGPRRRKRHLTASPSCARSSAVCDRGARGLIRVAPLDGPGDDALQVQPAVRGCQRIHGVLGHAVWRTSFGACQRPAACVRWRADALCAARLSCTPSGFVSSRRRRPRPWSAVQRRALPFGMRSRCRPTTYSHRFVRSACARPCAHAARAAASCVRGHVLRR